MARVTVCIPTYKRTRWLADTIASALGQTFTDLVVEVHDDATPGDEVARVVDQFDDPRLRLIAHKTNAGIVGNFTRSLLGAETEYVLQLGDDDVADPRLVELTVAALDAHPSAGVAHSRFAIVDDAGKTLDPDQDWLETPSPPLESRADFVERSMDHGCRICSSTALIRRAAVPDGAFRQEDYPQFDFAFWLRMAEHWDVAFVSETLCRYRVHLNSHTSALSDVTGTGYLSDERALRQVHALKLRHLSTLPEQRHLKRIADRSLRRDLVGRVRIQTLPDRRLGPTVRGLRRAARHEPRLLADPLTWALLVGALLGPRRLDRLKGRA